LKVEDLAGMLEKASLKGDRWTACCPAHKDRTPSLVLTQAPDKILLYCYAGCTAQEIVDSLGGEP